MKTELLIGCGSTRKKCIYTEEMGSEWSALTTLDMMASHEPDVVWDLECLPLPFPADSFDEIHAYEVLEHTGRQGDWRFFFAQFNEFWRILKPGGLLIGSSPSADSPWAWGDPGHTRLMTPQCFVFLDQSNYSEQIGKTAMSDYRSVYAGDFEPLVMNIEDGHFAYIVKAHKPVRSF